MEPRIALLVDDDNDFRSLFSEVLREEGYGVVEASNGVEAMAVLDELTPDVLLIDLVMPTMNGWALFRRLQQRSELRTVPVVFLSAMPQLAPVGGAMTVSKPLTLQNLTALLEALRPARTSSEIPLKSMLHKSPPPSSRH
jgi:CheY-like chemotaxis protein